MPRQLRRDGYPVRMRRVTLLSSLLLIGSAANAEPASTLAELSARLNACTRVLAVPPEATGSEMTILLSIKRDGSLQGQPRITYSHLTGDESTQRAFVGGTLTSVAKCFPLSITDSLGGAVAGRPFRLRIVGRPRQRDTQNERARFPDWPPTAA